MIATGDLQWKQSPRPRKTDRQNKVVLVSEIHGRNIVAISEVGGIMVARTVRAGSFSQTI
jgi:hypothetical protein